MMFAVYIIKLYFHYFNGVLLCYFQKLSKDNIDGIFPAVTTVNFFCARCVRAYDTLYYANNRNKIVKG